MQSVRDISQKKQTVYIIRGGGVTVFCNPPYGRKVIEWVKKAAAEAANGATVVMLIAARTDTIAFHDYIYNKPNVEIRFLKGRLKFLDENNEAGDSAPFPSMVVIFRPPERTGENGKS